jgi:hypothetical protein
LNKIKNIKKVYSSSKEETGMGEEWFNITPQEVVSRKAAITYTEFVEFTAQ